MLPTVGLAKSACGYDCEQLLLALDHSEELFPKNTNRPRGSGEEQDSKLGNSLTLAFLVSKRVIGHDLIQLEVVRITMYEENSMDF